MDHAYVWRMMCFISFLNRLSLCYIQITGLHFCLLAAMVWKWQCSDSNTSGKVDWRLLLIWTSVGILFLLTFYIISTISLIYCSFASRATCSASRRSSTWSARWVANFLFVYIRCASVPLILQLGVGVRFPRTDRVGSPEPIGSVPLVLEKQAPIGQWKFT
jgi:hypothetical protein